MQQIKEKLNAISKITKELMTQPLDKDSQYADVIASLYELSKQIDWYSKPVIAIDEARTICGDIVVDGVHYRPEYIEYACTADGTPDYYAVDYPDDVQNWKLAKVSYNSKMYYDGAFKETHTPTAHGKILDGLLVVIR